MCSFDDLQAGTKECHGCHRNIWFPHPLMAYPQAPPSFGPNYTFHHMREIRPEDLDISTYPWKATLGGEAMK